MPLFVEYTEKKKSSVAWIWHSWVKTASNIKSVSYMKSVPKTGVQCYRPERKHLREPSGICVDPCHVRLSKLVTSVWGDSSSFPPLPPCFPAPCRVGDHPVSDDSKSRQHQTVSQLFMKHILDCESLGPCYWLPMAPWQPAVDSTVIGVS